MTTFNIFHTTRVRIRVRDAPHIWGAGEIRDAGKRRLFGGLARSKPFVTPHIWGIGEMSTELSATYLGCWGNKHCKSRRIYVALGHDELKYFSFAQNIQSDVISCCSVFTITTCLFTKKKQGLGPYSQCMCESPTRAMVRCVTYSVYGCPQLSWHSQYMGAHNCLSTVSIWVPHKSNGTVSIKVPHKSNGTVSICVPHKINGTVSLWVPHKSNGTVSI